MVDFHDLNYELGLILFQLILSCFFAYTICVSKDYFQFVWRLRKVPMGQFFEGELCSLIHPQIIYNFYKTFMLRISLLPSPNGF